MVTFVRQVINKHTNDIAADGNNRRIYKEPHPLFLNLIINKQIFEEKLLFVM